jgi:hypothetical protein
MIIFGTRRDLLIATFELEPKYATHWSGTPVVKK